MLWDQPRYRHKPWHGEVRKILGSGKLQEEIIIIDRFVIECPPVVLVDQQNRIRAYQTVCDNYKEKVKQAYANNVLHYGNHTTQTNGQIRNIIVMCWIA